MYVLRISGAFQHDAAACLLDEDRLIAMAEEERFRRLKSAFRQRPIFSSLYCLGAAGISMSDVDVVAVSWDPGLSCGASTSLTEYVEEFFGDAVWIGHKKPPVVFVPAPRCARSIGLLRLWI